MKKNTFLMLGCFIIISLNLLIIAGCGEKQDESKVQITTASNEARADFIKGRDLFEKLKGQESLEYFEKAYNNDKDFALAYYYHSFSNPTAKGFFEDLDMAVKSASKVTEGERLMIMALQAAVNGDQKLQEEYLTDLKKNYPNDERVQNLAGQFYYTQQDYDKAIDHLNQAVQLAPEYAASYNMLGYSYMNQHNFREAEKAYKKYIELIPDDPNPYDSYAELLMKEGLFEESITQYKKALEKDPNFVASHVGIATNYNFMNKYEEARKELQTLFDKAKNDGQKRTALFAMTVSYIHEGKFDQAMEQLNKQYELGKTINDYANMSGDLNFMGNLLFETAKYDDAMKKYDESLQVMVNSNLSEEVKETAKRTSLYNKAKIQLMKNDIAGAKKTSMEFMDKAAKSNNIFQIRQSHELEGLIALQEKDYRKADTEFQKANLQDPYTHYYLGIVDQGLKDGQNAKKHFDEAAKFNALNNMNQSFIKHKKIKKSIV